MSPVRAADVQGSPPLVVAPRSPIKTLSVRCLWPARHPNLWFNFPLRLTQMLALLAAFAASFVVAVMLVRSSFARRSFFMDSTGGTGPQKLHAGLVPRVGGLAVAFGLAAGIAFLVWRGGDSYRLGLAVALCGVPLLVAGLVEDLTKRVSAKVRLAAAVLSAGLAVYVLDARIAHAGLPLLDQALAVGWVAVSFTVFVVAGMANAVNIVDGLNGLASMCVVLMLGSLVYVAYQVNDSTIGTLALVGIGAVLGFFVLNYPAGLIFLGDGGAYLLGFWYAELAILLLVRNPGAVSPLYPLLAAIYPVFEVAFSIYRRRVLRGHPTDVPDGIHLHSLMYRRLLRWATDDRSARALTRRNSMTSPYLWLLCMLAVVPATVLYEYTHALGAFLALFVVTYVVLYWRIVRFRMPRWMRKPNGQGRLVRGDDMVGRRAP